MLTCFSILVLWTLCGKPMNGRQKALFCYLLFFGGAWIFGGWGVVGWGRKSYLGPAEIVSFSSWSFSRLNQIWFECETLLLIFLMRFYYISFAQQLYADVLQCLSLRPATLLKRDSNTGAFLWNLFLAKLTKFLRTSFFKEHLRWLLLYILYRHDITCNLSR